MCPHLRCMPSMSSVIFLVTAYLARRQFFTARMWLRAFRTVSAAFCTLSPLAPCSTPFPLLCVRLAARYSSKVSICRRHQVLHATQEQSSKTRVFKWNCFHLLQHARCVNVQEIELQNWVHACISIDIYHSVSRVGLELHLDASWQAAICAGGAVHGSLFRLRLGARAEQGARAASRRRGTQRI